MLNKLDIDAGVNNIDIDMRQHKVVVMGNVNVNGDMLIKKLNKAGKHAELWPQKSDSKMKNQTKPENKEKQSDAESSSEGITQSGENDNDSVKVVTQDTPKTAETNNTSKNSEGCGSVNVNKPNEGCVTGKTGVQFQELPRQEVRQTVVLPPAGPVTEKKVSIAVQVPNDNEATWNENKTGGAGAGTGGKKKKKKTTTGKASNNIINNNNGNEGASISAAVTVDHRSDDTSVTGAPGNQSRGQGVNGPGSAGSVPIFSRPANGSPPRHHHSYREYPPHYYAPPPGPPHVVHSVSYHTAHPSSSYGAAYYAPPQPYSYTHVVRPGNEMERPPPYMYEPESYTSSHLYTSSYTSSQPSDSFELFSDENPNACSAM